MSRVRTAIAVCCTCPDCLSCDDVSMILFQRDDCHLCDQALALLAAARAPTFHSVFIEIDAALEVRYGTRVPVLRDDSSGLELDWPFDLARLRDFLVHVRSRG